MVGYVINLLFRAGSFDDEDRDDVVLVLKGEYDASRDYIQRLFDEAHAVCMGSENTISFYYEAGYNAATLYGKFLELNRDFKPHNLCVNGPLMLHHIYNIEIGCK